jgi:hypothetical protein
MILRFLKRITKRTRSREQEVDSPPDNTPLRARLARVGIRPKRACQEKTITFEGAQLFHTLAITLDKFFPNEEVEKKRLWRKR